MSSGACFPLAGGQMIIWLGAAALLQTPLWEIPAQLCAVGINSLLTLIVLFAPSALFWNLFSATVRVSRLMELMSLEQPLMQELMVTIPGTYHHSLVVANMVEAGAKAIGANSPSVQGRRPLPRCGASCPIPNISSKTSSAAPTSMTASRPP